MDWPGFEVCLGLLKVGLLCKSDGTRLTFLIPGRPQETAPAPSLPRFGFLLFPICDFFLHFYQPKTLALFLSFLSTHTVTNTFENKELSVSLYFLQ